MSDDFEKEWKEYVATQPQTENREANKTRCSEWFNKGRGNIDKKLEPLFEAHDKAKGKKYVLQGNPNLDYDFIESVSNEIEKLKAEVKK